MSLFRPRGGVDQSPLDEHRKLIAAIDRRGVLRSSLSLGALTLLSGCDVSNGPRLQGVLRAISRWNDSVQGALFSPTRLAPTFGDAQVMRPPRFNAFYDKEHVKPVDRATWKLEFAGLVADKRPLSIADIYAMPHVAQVTRHVCVEGWDYIGKWTGVPLRTMFERVGADLTAQYVAFKCYDGYSGSIDMASALHPQTQLTTRYADEILPDAFGFPIRLRCATKLGYKTPKWITAIEVTNTHPGGYWEDRGYNWFGGI